MSTFQQTRSRLIGAVLCAGLLFGLAACGDDDDDDDAAQSGATNGGSSSTTASPEAEPDPEDSDEDAEDPDEGTDDEGTEDAVPASGTACLLGTWLTDNNNVGAMLQGTAGDVDVNAPTGEALITFSEGARHSFAYNAWTFEMSHEGVTVEVVREGTDTGTYQANEDGHLTITDTDMGSVVDMTSPAGTHSTPGEPSTMTGTFTCQGNLLEITAEGSTSILNRQ